MNADYSVLVLAISLVIPSCSSQYTIKEPTRTPAPPSNSSRSLITEGITAYNAGSYTNAQELFQRALSEQPDNVEALFELALTYSALEQHEKSLAGCIEAMDYQWPELNKVYLLAGTELDYLGRSDDAIDMYEAGIKRYPNDLLLYYNLGVTRLSRQEIDDAKDAFKTAVVLRSTHPSSHLALAQAFLAEGNKLPALFAFSRFLILEPSSERSNVARQGIASIIFGNVQKDPKDPNRINVSMALPQTTSEGDFGGIAVFIYLSSAFQIGKSKQGMPDIDQYTEVFKNVFSIAGEDLTKNHPSQFVWKYYIPYFVELNNHNYVRAFVEHSIIKPDNPTETTRDFLEWSEKYNWSTTAR